MHALWRSTELFVAGGQLIPVANALRQLLQSRSLVSECRDRPRLTDREVWMREGEEAGGVVEVGACAGAQPDGLNFIDIAPVGTILAPGRVWAMLEGANDVRKALHAPCCGEIAEINYEAVRKADASGWLIKAHCDRVLPSMKPE